MKLSPDSPELTAYLLNELDPAGRAQIEAALQRSPELRAEVEALRLTCHELTRELATEPVLELSPDQRRALLESARPPEPAPEAPVSRHPESVSPSWWTGFLKRKRPVWIWVLPVGAGALALTLMLLPQPVPTKGRWDELRYADNTQFKVPALASESVPTRSQAGADVDDSLAVAPFAPSTPPAAPLARAVTDTKQTGPELGEREALGLAANARGGAGGIIAPAEPGQNQSGAFYRMDPVLARRYGMMPMAPGGAPAGLGAAQAESLARGGIQTGKEAEQREQDGRRAYQAEGLRERDEELGDRYQPLDPNLARRGRLIPEQRGRLIRPGGESYDAITDNPFRDVLSARLSTFGLDVDTASYANVRRFLREGSLPPRDAVRLEELINYFRYDYPAPDRGEPFAAVVEIADTPWKEGNKLVRIGLQAQSVTRPERPAANLVFLLDVSGSMEPENKLPLVKRSLRLLLDRLDERDSVGIVTYAGESRIALEPTTVTREGRDQINRVIEELRAGSGTAGAAGIVDAYRLATNRFDREQVNRVILCTDGDFNIGISDAAGLQRLIEEKARTGVFLSVLGYGLGNLRDSTLELLADKGNGNYAYVDSFTEARKVLSEQLEGTLVTVAKDVKVQVEFNPARVKSYRLLGYENRVLRNRDFNDDTKDAGEVGAGHQVTVLYEIEPATTSLAGVGPLRYGTSPETESVVERTPPPQANELLNLKLRYKAPDSDTSRLIEQPIQDADRDFAAASADFKLAAAVAGYGMLLRDSPYRGELTWEKVLRWAEQGLGSDREGYRSEFVDLVRRAQQLSGRR